MKQNIKNILLIISGILLFAAIALHFLQMRGMAMNLILITASLIAGYSIMIKAIQAVRMKVFSFDLLVTIAVIGALMIGEYAESAVVTFLFLFGAYLEARTLEKARGSARALLHMEPMEAIVIRNEKQFPILAEAVEEGDHVIIQSGGKVPVDGTIFSGRARINESAITGESFPANKERGDHVFSGTILDSGYLEVISEKVGEDTSFAKIIEMMEGALESKVKTQIFLEQFASLYTPGILVLSVFVLLITWDIHLTLTFLVIACPGALVISAPVSIAAGIGNRAK